MITIKHFSLFDLLLIIISLQHSKEVVGEFQARFDAVMGKFERGIESYFQNTPLQQLKDEMHGISLIMGKHDSDLKKVFEIFERAIQVKIDLEELKRRNTM